jgi:hypothetical protein
MRSVYHKIQVFAFKLYLIVFMFMFVEMVFEMLNSDRLLLILSMVCLLLSVVFYPIQTIKSKRRFILFFPLIGGLFFEGISIIVACLSDILILSERLISVNIILSVCSVWEYYRLNIKKKEYFSF